MNVLLMTSRTNDRQDGAELADHMPYGLGYIAATLKKHSDHQVDILDISHSSLSDDGIADLIASKRIDVLGISAVMANYVFCVEFTAAIRRRFPHLLIVMGGALPTTMPDLVAQDCAVDVVVRGPGELAFLDIVNAAGPGGKAPTRIVQGGYPKDIDAIPWPDWEAMDFRSYKYLPPWSDFPLLSSRGCPFACNYCCKVNGSAYVERDIDHLFAELCHVVEQLGFDHFMIQDDLFFLKPERVRRLCRLITGRGMKVRWSAVSRIDLMDEETIICLKEAGCFAVAVGVESGSQDMLVHMNKKLSLAKTAANLQLLHRHGIKIMPYIICGYPGETAETLKQTEDFLIANRIYSAMTYAFPLPGTKLWDIAVERGMIPDVRAFLRRRSFHVSRPHFNFTQMPDAELESRVEAMKQRVLGAYIDHHLGSGESLGEAASIYIYGSGYLGRGAYDHLLGKGIPAGRIRSFIDDDPLRVGKSHHGVPVAGLDALQLNRNDLCFVANSYFPENMVGNLRKHGFQGSIVTL